jgi:predicted RNA-binding protein YlxR (DUF448 family)
VRVASAVAVPQRTCIGCRRVGPSDTLVRFTVRQGRVALADPRPDGRGAWLCPARECFESAVRRKAFDRAFHAKVALHDDLLSEFDNLCDQRRAVR